MTERERRTNSALEGRRIVRACVGGAGLTLELDDGVLFEYDASDGGYSMWRFVKDGSGIHV